MRFTITMIVSILLFSFATIHAADLSIKNNDVDDELRTATDMLRRAGELAAEQDRTQNFWTDRLLLQIGAVQMRAKDYLGARKSLRASSDNYGRNAGLIDLAQDLAREGRREESLDVLNELGSKHGWQQDLINDDVRLCWIEHLITTGDFKSSLRAIEELESRENLPKGYLKLAIASATAGETSMSAHSFKLAKDAAFGLEGSDRVRAMWEIGEAQQFVGEVDAAKETILLMLDEDNKLDAWTKFASRLKAAQLAALMNDRQSADSLFRQAIIARQGVNALNKVNAVRSIAMAQAQSGYIGDALKTAELTQTGEHEEILTFVSEAQLRANDLEGAEQTAFSIKNGSSYRDLSLDAIIEFCIKNGEFKRALSAAEKVVHPSRKACEFLKVATAYAKSGDRKMAENIASQIKLVRKSEFSPFGGGPGFDYRRPESWGKNYAIGDAFTMMGLQLSYERTADVAKHAMELAQALPLDPKPDYVELFNDINSGEVIFALARAHAATGEAHEALVWAQRVGSEKKVTDKEDFEAAWALERRIYALVGVAEGLLDKFENGSPR